MATEAEIESGHRVIARLFDLPVSDMGGGLRIVSPTPKWLPVEERDVIVKAVRAFIAKPHEQSEKPRTNQQSALEK